MDNRGGTGATRRHRTIVCERCRSYNIVVVGFPPHHWFPPAKRKPEAPVFPPSPGLPLSDWRFPQSSGSRSPKFPKVHAVLSGERVKRGRLTRGPVASSQYPFLRLRDHRVARSVGGRLTPGRVQPLDMIV